VELLLFADEFDARPASFLLDPKRHRTFDYWHIFVKDLLPGQLYGYRVHGDFCPEEGLRFNGEKVLLDPYAKSISSAAYNRDAAIEDGDNVAHCYKSVVIDTNLYDWSDDDRPRKINDKAIIYEMHVGGFTKDPSSGVAENLRGTYRGMIEKIPYLVELGITAVELLPCQQFDALDVEAPLINYWGYSPVGFFAVHNGYSASKDYHGTLDEFRDLVKALHKAGIEVILDVVFNHTAEGNDEGPTFSFRGIDNKAYYVLDEDPEKYANYTGCGNTISANHPVVHRMIIDCLKFWVSEMHVDGFRFDLASILSRDVSGQPLQNPPVILAIDTDPILAGTKIIAEAWDAAGLYQVGSFMGRKWAEWNGKFRDDVRRFIKGDAGLSSVMMHRITGSPDIYNHSGFDSKRSVNFVTAHDGFTINDLVSYNFKCNLQNLENNRDGSNDNYSWNCGIEGPTTDETVENLRIKQIKNLFVLLLFSQGTPMLLMGDEIRRTQLGNNNAYCQDNELSWFPWGQIEQHKEILEFVKKTIHFVKTRNIFNIEEFWNNNDNIYGEYLAWHGTELNKPDFGHFSRTLAYTLRGLPGENEFIHVMCNSYWSALEFQLPPLTHELKWNLMIDTARLDGFDFLAVPNNAMIGQETYWVQPRSTVVLVSSW